ncbi:40S ribosomal protein S27, partial [Lemmus lemmus]
IIAFSAKDLLHPSPEEEKRKHKKKRLVQSPNSYFMDVKCPGCYKITTVFSHAQMVGSLVCRLLHCPLSAYRRESKTDRRMLLQEEAALKST